jgi:hypothetical protein
MTGVQLSGAIPMVVVAIKRAALNFFDRKMRICAGTRPMVFGGA